MEVNFVYVTGERKYFERVATEFANFKMKDGMLYRVYGQMGCT